MGDRIDLAFIWRDTGGSIPAAQARVDRVIADLEETLLKKDLILEELQTENACLKERLRCLARTWLKENP